MSKRSPFATVALPVCKAFLKIFYPYEVVNANCLPEDQAVVLCSNHLSNLDPIFLNVTSNKLIHFMAKQELFKNKLLAKIITALGAFPVNRGSDGGKAIGVAEELARQNECIGIFIEGTRSKTGQLGRGHMGALLIAKEMNIPVIPCCITGKKTFIKPFCKTKITYGKPISCEELGILNDDKRALRAGTKMVMDKIAELREQHNQEFAAKGK